jgi:hypothetical protein
MMFAHQVGDSAGRSRGHLGVGLGVFRAALSRLALSGRRHPRGAGWELACGLA